MIILAAFALVLVTATCLLLSLRALGTRWPWEVVACPVPPSVARYKHIRFAVDESGNGHVLAALRVLERHGFTLVLESRTGWDGRLVVTLRKAVTP